MARMNSNHSNVLLVRHEPLNTESRWPLRAVVASAERDSFLSGFKPSYFNISMPRPRPATWIDKNVFRLRVGQPDESMGYSRALCRTREAPLCVTVTKCGVCQTKRESDFIISNVETEFGLMVFSRSDFPTWVPLRDACHRCFSRFKTAICLFSFTTRVNPKGSVFVYKIQIRPGDSLLQLR